MKLFIDKHGRLWKGPHRVGNFHYSRCHGIGSNGRERWVIWVAERSSPDSEWMELAETSSELRLVERP